MSNLPITQKEYDQSVLVADFIAKTRSIAQSNEDISDICFMPKVKGYEITFNNGTTAINISLNFKSKILKGIKIKKLVNGATKGSFYSKSQEDNTCIINKIFDKH
ncbi:MAG: hypothetical protein IJF40_07310 [Clostridia bacterium]|nr:hypothetical protein [Clostridia bacterium]